MKTEYKEPLPYEIDSKLKPGKHIPEALGLLLTAFMDRKNLFISSSKAGERQFEKDLAFIEKNFKQFFSPSPLDPRIRIEIITRVNQKMQKARPMLLPHEGRERLTIAPEDGKDIITSFWVKLAELIEGLDRSMVHICPECQKWFISKQRKKFHPGCRVKYLARIYRESGKANLNLQRFRAKQKKRAGGPKKQA